MRSSLTSRSTLLRLLGTLVTLTLMIYLLSQQGWDEIAGAITQIRLRPFILALMLIFLSRFFVISRWHILLTSAGVGSTWQQSTRITFAGLFANNFLPSTVGGDLARLGGALQQGFDAATSAASLVMDRAIGLLGMTLVLPIGLQKVILLRASAAALPFSSALAAEASWLNTAFRRIVKLSQRIISALKIWLSKPRALLMALFATLLHMAALFLAISLLLEGMGDSLPFWQIAGLWSLVYVITLLPFTINALGLQEVSIGFAFSQLGDVSTANSLVLALLVRTLFMLASLPGAFFLSDVLPGIAKAKPLLKKIDG